MNNPQPSPTGIGFPVGSPPGSVPPSSSVEADDICFGTETFKSEVNDRVVIPLDVEKPEEAALLPDRPLTINEPPPPPPSAVLLF